MRYGGDVAATHWKTIYVVYDTVRDKIAIYATQEEAERAARKCGGHWTKDKVIEAEKG